MQGSLSFIPKFPGFLRFFLMSPQTICLPVGKKPDICQSGFDLESSPDYISVSQGFDLESSPDYMQV